MLYSRHKKVAIRLLLNKVHICDKPLLKSKVCQKQRPVVIKIHTVSNEIVFNDRFTSWHARAKDFEQNFEYFKTTTRNVKTLNSMYKLEITFVCVSGFRKQRLVNKKKQVGNNAPGTLYLLLNMLS